MLCNPIRTGVIPLSLMMSLTACTTTVVERLTPPETLLADCPAPAPPARRTNGALAQSILDYQTALDRCNDSKAALRVWAR